MTLTSFLVSLVATRGTPRLYLSRSRVLREDEFDVRVVDNLEGRLHGGAGGELNAQAQDVLVGDQVGGGLAFALAGEVETAQIPQTYRVTLAEVFDHLGLEGTHGGFHVVFGHGRFVRNLVVETVAFDGRLEGDGGIEGYLREVLGVLSGYGMVSRPQESVMV